jgi:hypothetical protein
MGSAQPRPRRTGHGSWRHPVDRPLSRARSLSVSLPSSMIWTESDTVGVQECSKSWRALQILWWLLAGRPGFGSRQFQGFTLRCHIQADSGAHPMGTGCSLSGDKAIREWSWPFPRYSAEVKFVWRYTSTVQHVFIAWCLLSTEITFNLFCIVSLGSKDIVISCFLFGRSQVQISARRPVIFTEAFGGFP